MGTDDDSLGKITITNTRPEHAEDACVTVRRAFRVGIFEECDECMAPNHIYQQIERFPEGQFVALYHQPEEDIAIGMAATMRISQAPSQTPRKWLDQLGGLDIKNHEPQGEWLYGVEMAVRPVYRSKGIGTALYNARFELVKRLNLRGWYAVGMLMGYYHYQHEMSVVDYGKKVIAREIKDPTVTMQMNRGFEAWEIVTDYLDEPEAGDSGVLIVWHNPEYKHQA